MLPDGRPGSAITEEELQQHFDDFFEDIFWELEDKYGEIEEMNICDNLGDHLIGNVYIKFKVGRLDWGIGRSIGLGNKEAGFLRGKSE